MNQGDETMTDEEHAEFLRARKEAGRKIDPKTAEVTWVYAFTLDRYGIYDLPEELRQVGREYFARAPGSDIWVDFGDLPHAIREALWARHESKLVFPAGLREAIARGRGPSLPE
jgi:hypothetical protein